MAPARLGKAVPQWGSRDGANGELGVGPPGDLPAQKNPTANENKVGDKTT